MEDLVRYLDEIVDPTIDDFEKTPTSVRHAFLACVVTLHSLDYLAYDRTKGKTVKAIVGNLKDLFGKESPHFKLVDHVAHAFKHVVSGNPQSPNLRSDEVVKRGGAFSTGFSSRFDVGVVTIVGRPEVNLLATVKEAVNFLRKYRPATRTLNPRSERRSGQPRGISKGNRRTDIR